MKLTDEERHIIVNLEYEKALSCLKQAESIAEMDFWDTVSNRMYYAIFHTVSALLIHDGHEVSTHKDNDDVRSALCQDREIHY